MGLPSARPAPTLLLTIALLAGLVTVDPDVAGPVSAQTGLPDLVVTNVTVFVSDWDHGHTMTVSIQNQGTEASTVSFATRVVIDDGYETTLMFYGATNAGETRAVTTNLPNWYPGTHTFNITTDTTGKVTESNEGNNKLVRTLHIDSGPDLSIQSMEIVNGSDGHLLKVLARNQGQTYYGRIDLHVYVPGILNVTQSRWGLEENGTWTLHLSLNGWRTGWLSVNATLDPAGIIAERDETNNQHITSLPTPGAPRITIRNLTIDDSHIALNEPILVDWEVHNTGTVDAWSVPLDIRFVGEPAGMSRSTRSIAAGSAHQMSEGYLMAPAIGDVTLRITVDPEGAQGEITSGTNVFELPIHVFEPQPLGIDHVYVGNQTRWVDDTRYEDVTVQATGTGDHVGSNARFHLYDGDRLVGSTQALAEPGWYGGLLHPPADNMTYYHAGRDTYGTTFWHVFTVPTNVSHEPAFRVVVRMDNGTAWESTAEGHVGQTTFVEDAHHPPPPPHYGVPPSAPREDPWRPVTYDTTPVQTVDVPVAARDGREEPEQPDDLPVMLEVEHVDTRPDPEHPGAHLLEFRVKGLGPGGTSTDLGVVAKVGWQIEVLTSSQNVAAGGTKDFVLRLSPPESGRTSSTITVGAWGDAARAEPVVVNVRSLTTTGTAAGHPIPVWGYVSGGAAVAAAAGAFVWFAEPRRYGFLRYLLAMFPVVGGFSRIQGQKVLEHEARERIHQAIEAQPGIHYRALLRELQMSNGQLAHHLQTLEREGIVRTEALAGKLHFYVAGSSAVRGTQLSDRQRALLTMIKKEPGILQSRLAERLGVSRQALHQHLDPLREQKLLLDARYGRTKALYLESDADQRLTVCPACRSFYDRGPGMATGVVCPSCGQNA